MELEKFWLGNVNEKGEVDQEGYDEETIRIVNEKGSSLKGKLDVAEDGMVTEAAPSAEDDDAPIQKAADAVDYSHEVETAGDEARAGDDTREDERNFRRAEQAFQATQQQAVLTARRAAVDDDYDDEEPHQGEAADSASALQASTASQADTTTLGASIQPQGSTGVASEPAPTRIPRPTAVPPQAAPPLQPAQDAGMGQAVEAPAAQQPQSKGDSIRKHGLLLFSEMFLGPSLQPRIQKTRC